MEKDDIRSSFFVGGQGIAGVIEPIDCRLRSCVSGLADAQMQQSPHLAGFVVESWWSRGDLNPRPPVLRCRYYMRSRVY